MDATQRLLDQVQTAIDAGQSLLIQGGGTKSFLGRVSEGALLDVSEHRGVVNYDPKELVITARSGTPLKEINSVLTEHGQMLPFEPPAFGPAATLGGTIACGLSGPRRAYQGAARDFVLGVRLINGRGEVLRFGGEVMKNVAGYDASRLLTGAMGTLGVLLDISIKVIPKPGSEVTLEFEKTAEQAIQQMNTLVMDSIGLSATVWSKGKLHCRFSGSEALTHKILMRFRDEGKEKSGEIWEAIREQTFEFFNRELPLWRLSVPALAKTGELDQQLIEWSGAQRWLFSTESPEEVRRKITLLGGHATLYRNHAEHSEVFHPLSDAHRALQSRIKRAFDPDGLFNPGRMYSGI